VSTEYTYEPFGVTTQTGVSSADPFQYTGLENDGTGLYYYRARYYDPTRYRFLSEDSLGLQSGDSNLYAYVLNDPMTFNDPLGLAAGRNALLAFLFFWRIFGNPQIPGPLESPEPSPIVVDSPAPRPQPTPTTPTPTAPVTAPPGETPGTPSPAPPVRPVLVPPAILGPVAVGTGVGVAIVLIPRSTGGPRTLTPRHAPPSRFRAA
jgi:RHS repeat-associated protein